MIDGDAELREVTKLVLYGWGYPTLFNCPNGNRLQNRLVSFPVTGAPAIAGVNKEAFGGVLSRLEMVGEQYLDFLKAKYLGVNPAWIWVDTPESLSADEILTYRKQFEEWAERIKTTSSKNNAPAKLTMQVQSAGNFLQHLLSKRWRRATIAVLIFTAISLTMFHAGG
ncbi:hypothetical protein IFO70_23455 [Phormidium tenue FACHB-886]|nr:hypothetical protein [Phormidium tenue FACHB-886]